ncbi:hypothetical protein [Pseudomonas graminis]
MISAISIMETEKICIGTFSFATIKEKYKTRLDNTLKGFNFFVNAQTPMHKKSKAITSAIFPP